MLPVINVSLSVLIVDDENYKIEKLKDFFCETNPNSIVTIVFDRISALQKLASDKYDLMILDMQLPNRHGESEPDIEGGIILLEEIELSDSYIQPTRIIALTEYEDLQVNIRDNYPELGAIKFDITSDLWKVNLHRCLNSLSKSKIASKKIIYCEGDNNIYYNSIGLPGIEFWSLNNSRSIYLAAKNEKDKSALRDRDFLTTNEINKLKKLHSNYFILEYYCFENYIYHPDNINELLLDFNKTEYIEELTNQKNEKISSIIQDYKIARSSYTEFTDNNKKDMDKNPELEIVESLKSNDFEAFYKFFDMAGKCDQGHKKSFNKKYLEKYNLEIAKLAKTEWFKQKISSIILSVS